MNLIDTSYFINYLKLPIANIQADLTRSITLYEPEILEKCLGFDLYYTFINADYSETKWDELRNGVVYQDADGLYKKWTGFVNTEKSSLIANYVFFKFTSDNSTYSSANTNLISQSENGTATDWREKQRTAYNKMVDMICELDEFITFRNSQDPTTYPNYDPKPFTKLNVFNI